MHTSIALLSGLFLAKDGGTIGRHSQGRGGANEAVVVNAKKMVVAQRAHSGSSACVPTNGWRRGRGGCKSDVTADSQRRQHRQHHQHHTMLAAPPLMMGTSRHDNRTLWVMYRVFGSG